MCLAERLLSKDVKSIVLFITILFLTGCGPRSLTAGAENIGIYNSYPVNSCKFLGDIENPSVHENLNLSSSVEEIKRDDNNFLKNEGAKLGANIVVLIDHSEYQTQVRKYGKQSGLSKPSYFTVNSHKIKAKAYRCTNLKNYVKRDIAISHNPLLPGKN